MGYSHCGMNSLTTRANVIMSEKPHDLASRDSRASGVSGKTLTVEKSIVKNQRPPLFQWSPLDCPIVGRICLDRKQIVMNHNTTLSNPANPRPGQLDTMDCPSIYYRGNKRTPHFQKPAGTLGHRCKCREIKLSGFCRTSPWNVAFSPLSSYRDP